MGAGSTTSKSVRDVRAKPSNEHPPRVKAINPKVRGEPPSGGPLLSIWGNQTHGGGQGQHWSGGKEATTQPGTDSSHQMCIRGTAVLGSCGAHLRLGPTV